MIDVRSAEPNSPPIVSTRFPSHSTNSADGFPLKDGDSSNAVLYSRNDVYVQSSLLTTGVHAVAPQRAIPDFLQPDFLSVVVLSLLSRRFERFRFESKKR